MSDNLKILEQVDAKQEYPWVDSEGNVHKNLVRYVGTNGCKIRNASTGEIYDEAVEIYPCHTKYYETDIPLDENAKEDTIDGDDSNNQEGMGGENDEE